ncbi:uncharacterized protein IWZ02DRAFT_133963 [Phyllosticta citriasiana]|uniref:uncharacterized protein n=1 Tax=Phyllosticta citriasiana TaxID=595635 RepID=UPI0030FDCEC6
MPPAKTFFRKSLFFLFLQQRQQGFANCIRCCSEQSKAKKARGLWPKVTLVISHVGLLMEPPWITMLIYHILTTASPPSTLFSPFVLPLSFIHNPCCNVHLRQSPRI